MSRSADAPERALVVTGGCCVVLGGLVAAVTGPLDVAHGSWLAAYLVLVCGVAQFVFGRLPAWLAARPRHAGLGWTQLGCWNLGNALVVAGTLGAVPALVDIGAGLLVVGIVLAGVAVRRTAAHNRASRLLGWSYRVLLLVLVVSVPVGIVLANLRAPA